MAKGNLLLGLSSGKLGDLVMYRSQGKQISRVRVRNIKNPKTSSQNLQRMILATVGTAVSKLKSIVDHSFEGVEYGAKSINYFRKLNMNALRVAAVNEFTGDGIQTANFNIKGYNYLVPNAYVVSRGSLNVNSYEIGRSQNARGNGVLLQTSGAIPSDIPTSYEEFLAMFSCKPGDQLTIIEARNLLSQQSVVYGDAVNTPCSVAKFRIVFNKSYSGSGSFVTEDGDAFVFADGVIDTARSTPGIKRLLHIYPTWMTDGSDAVQLSIPADTLFNCVAGAVIRSAEDGNGSWYRSNSKMVFADVTAAAADVYTSYGATSTENIGSDYYLNNALTTSTEDSAQPVTPSNFTNVELRGANADTTLAVANSNVTLTARVGETTDINYDYTLSFESNLANLTATPTGTASTVATLSKINGRWYLNANVAASSATDTFIVKIKDNANNDIMTITVVYQ